MMNNTAQFLEIFILLTIFTFTYIIIQIAREMKSPRGKSTAHVLNKEIHMSKTYLK